MGRSAHCGRLFLHEKLLSVYQSGSQALPRDACKNRLERQPSHVLGAGEICGQAAHPESRYERAAPKNEHGRGTRRGVGPLRLFTGDRAGLCFSSDRTGNPQMSSARNSLVTAYLVLGAQRAAPLEASLGLARVTVFWLAWNSLG